jgi:MFS transporter, DHA3 family, macrolide efflux protein
MIKNQFHSFPAFLIIMMGQFLSLLGSGITTFALVIWAWQETGQALTLALITFYSFVPAIVLGPIIGIIIDRWNRKSVLIFADLATALTTVGLLFLYTLGQLEIWHIYVVALWNGSFNALQLPALSAAITTMISKEHYSRASGVRAIASSLSGILAPVTAGILLAFADIRLILWIDLFTFGIAAVALLPVRIPAPPKTKSALYKGFWDETLYGFRYLAERKGLLGLLITFTIYNFVAMIGIVLLSALILARTGGNELVLGSIKSAVGIGGMVGASVISLWGGPRQRVRGVLLSLSLGSLFLIILGASEQLFGWLVAAFGTALFLPVADALFSAINQSKISPEVQGKVFSASRTISYTATPLAMLLSGFLADTFFEPAMLGNGVLAQMFHWLVGRGAGAGMGLLFVFSGVFGTLVGTVAYFYPPIRNLEVEIPDYDQNLVGHGSRVEGAI